MLSCNINKQLKIFKKPAAISQQSHPCTLVPSSFYIQQLESDFLKHKSDHVQPSYSTEVDLLQLQMPPAAWTSFSTGPSSLEIVPEACSVSGPISSHWGLYLHDAYKVNDLSSLLLLHLCLNPDSELGLHWVHAMLYELIWSCFLIIECLIHLMLGRVILSPYNIIHHHLLLATIIYQKSSNPVRDRKVMLST